MEQYIGIYKAPRLEDRPFINPGEEISFDVTADHCEHRRFRLFFTGETNTYYTWKSEPDCWVNYGKIDDSLSREDAFRAQYCVKLEGTDYPKILYKKILGEANLNYLPASFFDTQRWQPVMAYLPLTNYTDDWRFGILARGENIVKKDGAVLKMRLEIRFNHPGVSRHDITHPADLLYEIDLPDGSFDWQELSQDIVIPADKTASVCAFIEASHYEGTLYLESPFLISSNNFNILPDFSISGSQRPFYNWLGQNLSKKEWPNFELKINGKTFFSGELFERCHRNSECEVDIPQGFLQDGKNTVTLRLTSDFRDAPSYSINEIALLSEPYDDFNVISCPEIVTAGSPFSMLLAINRPLSLSLESDLIKLLPGETTVFEKPGLYALRLCCDRVCNDLPFALHSAGHSEACALRRCVEKPLQDGVVTGTGDMVYIRQTLPDMENFIRYYFSEHIGNLITIRPVYRWSGTRWYNPEVFEKFVPLMNRLGVKYSNMTDGREPEGQCSNPPIEVLAATQDGVESGFLGRQKHEQDGAYNYWFYNDFSNNPERELHYDLMVRNFQDYPDVTSHYEHTPNEQFFVGEDLSIFKHKGLPRDMRALTDYVVTQLRQNKYNNTRHTGPSIMFKYFYEAGFDWTGAELMYGPLEPVVAAMRGAYRSFGKTNGYGAHLAVQWSTYPHDAPEKFRRYRLALYLSYMHGITEINTEEGLLHLEEYFSYFNRFDNCTRALKAQQQDFYRYTLSHTRSGEFYAPFAFLHGRCDGFSCFTRAKVWGKDDFNFCDAEQSWDLIKLFYPVSELDGIYQHNCPTDHPVGFYTGTPRGNTDIIPIEKHDFSRYRAISFAAYNQADTRDLDALLSYVENGGTLVMGWPHLSTTTNRDSIEAGRLSFIDHPLVDAVAGSHALFARDFYCGNPVDICRDVHFDEIIATTDSGLPLAFIKNLGKGQVFFVNAAQYPAHAAVKPIYETIVSEISDRINAAEDSFIECGEDVGFTIFDQADGGRHIYVLAVDWYHSPETKRKAVLRLGDQKYALDVPFGSMLKIAVKDSIAVWSEDESVEVLLITGNIITVQGYGRQTVRIAVDGKVLEKEIDFTDNALQAISL